MAITASRGTGWYPLSARMICKGRWPLILLVFLLLCTAATAICIAVKSTFAHAIGIVAKSTLLNTPANTFDIVVKGTVTGEGGTPLPGVTIVLKGASRSAMTDEAGRFSISVPENGVLVFTYTGYERKEV